MGAREHNRFSLNDHERGCAVARVTGKAGVSRAQQLLERTFFELDGACALGLSLEQGGESRDWKRLAGVGRTKRGAGEAKIGG